MSRTRRLTSSAPVVRVQGQFHRAYPASGHRQGIGRSDDVIGVGQHFARLDWHGHRVARAQAGYGHRSLRGSKGGHEPAGFDHLAGVVAFVSGGAFNQVQQRQGGIVVFGIVGSGRQVQLRRRQADDEIAEPLVVGFQPGHVGGDAVFASIERRQHLALAGCDLLQRLHEVLRQQVLHHLPHRPAGTQERLGLADAVQRRQQRGVALVQPAQGALLPFGWGEIGVDWMGGRGKPCESPAGICAF